MKLYGLPQPLTGTETVTIFQSQNSQNALCTLPLATLLSYIVADLPASLPTSLPSKAGVLWNNGGVLSIS